jgi:periplasmic divalent cation tolerance protein
VRGGYLLVISTVGNPRDGERIGAELVRAGHAACATIVPGAVSHYVWQGALERSDEALLLVKTTKGAFPGMRKALLEAHPYDVPEVIALEIAAGSRAYLDWITSAVGRGPRTPSRGPRRGRPRPRSRR